MIGSGEIGGGSRARGPEELPLLVVVGPTGAGKSDLAVRLALDQPRGGEVVSADSQQVYRHFDVGTGKLEAAEQRGVPHHLIGVIDPQQPFSAARFVELADEVIARIRSRGRRPIVAGGTGLYVRALLQGLFPAPSADPELRREHRRLWQEEGPAAFLGRVRAVDPEAAARIQPQDFVRLSRALEVHQQTGVPLSEHQRRHGFAVRRFSSVLVGLSPPREILRQRIETRVDEMIARGWLAEVRRLLDLGYGDTRPMGSLGYRQLRDHLAGRMDLDEAVRQTKRDTWRFARRQLNWFSTEGGILWYRDVEETVAAGPGLLSRR